MRNQPIPPSPEVLRALHEDYMRIGLPANLSFSQYLKVIGFSNHSTHQHGLDDSHDVHRAPPGERERGGAEQPNLVSVPRNAIGNNLRVMVLLVDFNDRPGNVPVSHYESLLFSKGSHPTGSMRDYFLEVSLGKVDVTGEVHGWLRLPQPYDFYTNGESGTQWQSYPRNAPRMAEDAVQAALDSGVLFDQDLDALNNNSVTALFIVHAGVGAESQTSILARNGNIWSHKWALRFPRTVASNLRAVKYLTVPHDCRLGVCVHELGHLAFQWEDFYDPDYAENGEWDGSGDWDLMAGGSYNGGSNSPAHPMGWHKSQHNWIDVHDIRQSTRLSINPYTQDFGEVYKLTSSTFTSTQYLILENRTRFGFDAHLPGEGLLVWRVDESREQVAPTRPALQLVQADGRRELERVGDSNQGDSGDPFPGSANRQTLFDSGVPSSSFPLGDDCGIELRSIHRDPQSGIVTLDAIFDGVPIDQPPPEDQTDPTVITEVRQPNRGIPDNKPRGISDAIAVAATGRVRAITVAVDIQHTYVGDLRVELVAPSGQVAVLHNQTGEGQHNLTSTWSSASDDRMAVFDDVAANGDWTLKVSDHAARDTGTLQRWSLTLDAVETARAVDLVAQPKLAIPDNDPTGLASALHVGQGGIVRSVEVSVDITHTYIGDLRVELVNPAGDRALLHNRAGDDGKNLNQTWATQNQAELAVFVSKPARGAWVMRVSDHAGRDVGTLNEWSLKIGLSPGKAGIWESEDAADALIPDNSPVGVARALACPDDGTVQTLEVGIDIKHSYIGDLRVELVSPAGERALLHANAGRNKRALSIRLSSTDSALLAGLVGQPVNGDWVLRIVDSASRDVGRLQKWWLKAHYE